MSHQQHQRLGPRVEALTEALTEALKVLFGPRPLPDRCGAVGQPVITVIFEYTVYSQGSILSIIVNFPIVQASPVVLEVS